jgi:hypothetical protein
LNRRRESREGGLWQGYTLTALSLYDVNGGDVRPLTKEAINIHSSKDVERTVKPIQGEARYRFDGTRYKRSEGENLVPDIRALAASPLATTARLPLDGGFFSESRGPRSCRLWG